MSCPDCFRGVVHEGKPRGTTTTLHGLPAYVTKPSDPSKAKSGIVVIIPDAFGWKFGNIRLLADHYADKGGYTVYLPDFQDDKAAPLYTFDCAKIIFSSKAGILSRIYNVGWAAYGIIPFIWYNRIGASYSRVKGFFEQLRKDEGSQQPIGAAGFCWGGKHVVLLSKASEVIDGKPLLDVGFVGHPGALSIPSDIENISVPVSFALAEIDQQVSMKQAEKIKTIVEAKEGSARGESVVYKGSGHGFCVRADLNFDDVAEQAAQAEDQCIAWFQKHFKTAN